MCLYQSALKATKRVHFWGFWVKKPLFCFNRVFLMLNVVSH